MKSYDPKQESKNIYLDANNLYGYTMFKFLPTSGFKWKFWKSLNWINTLTIVWKDVILQC